jgi:hypothetical protein
MNLKNRIVAVLCTAALAVPALAYAKLSAVKGSEVTVIGTAIGVNFTMKMVDGLTVTDDGTTTAISFDGYNLQDADSEARRNEMRTKVFKQGHRTWHVIVKNADVADAVKNKKNKLPATIKSAWGSKNVTITDFAKVGDGDTFKAKGTITVNYKELGVPEICAEIAGVKGPCVKDTLTIKATVALKDG